MIVEQTERLLLKEFSASDIDGFFELNNDPVVLKYSGDRPFCNKEEVALFIKGYDQYKKYGLGRWSVYLKKTEEYIGFSGLRYSPETGEIDIGFRLMQKYWNQGYATESAKVGLQIAFVKHKADQIVARAMKGNSASHAVIQKLGMKYHSTFQEEAEEWIKYKLSKKSWLTQPYSQ